MFGSLRFLLAYLVILSHLVGTEYVAHFGFYAVRGFFVISGLMMTAALNEVYGFDGVALLDQSRTAAAAALLSRLHIDADRHRDRAESGRRISEILARRCPTRATF